MAKFPVERSDNDGIADALNYVLSGPAGLGQNFSGVSVSETGYLTGTVRAPFTKSTPIDVYVPPIPLGQSERLSPTTWKFTFETFASTGSSISGFVLTIGTLTSGTVGVGQFVTGSGVAAGTKIVSNISGSGSGSTWRVSISQTVSSTAIGGNYTDGVAPFFLGAPIDVVGATPSDYNGTYNAGAIECTPAYVIARTTTPFPNPGPGTGGTVGLSLAGGYVSTDGDATVVVNSATDRVFVSAQLLNTITYEAALTSQMFYTVAVNRYKLDPILSPGQTDILFELDETIAFRLYNFATLDPTKNSVPSDTFLAYSGNKAASAVTYPIVYTVNPTTVTGSGSNLSLEITQFPTGATIYTISNTSIKVVSGGEGYATGDTLVVPGNLLGGGATPANDMNLTVSGVTDGAVTLEPIDTLFTNIIDTPPPGYYRYILEVEFVPSTGSDAVITQCELGYRSLSCQVVKE